MKTKLFLFTVSLLAAGILFINCKGDEGAVGPAGAKGDAGTQGAAGVKGEAGAANVIYSEWIPMPAKATASIPGRKNYSFSAPKITQEVLDKGHVYGYIKYSATGIVPLPYANKILTGTDTYGSFLSTILLGPGSISFNQDWLTPGAIPSSFADANTVVGGYTHLRYIIVPGGVAAGKKAAIDYTDYEAVKKHYNLPE